MLRDHFWNEKVESSKKSVFLTISHFSSSITCRLMMSESFTYSLMMKQLNSDIISDNCSNDSLGVGNIVFGENPDGFFPRQKTNKSRINTTIVCGTIGEDSHGIVVKPDHNHGLHRFTVRGE